MSSFGASQRGAARWGRAARGTSLGEGFLRLRDDRPAIQLFKKGAIFSYLSIRLFTANRSWGSRPAWGGGAGREALSEGAGLTRGGLGAQLQPRGEGPGVVGQCVCAHSCVSTCVFVSVCGCACTHVCVHACVQCGVCPWQRLHPVPPVTLCDLGKSLNLPVPQSAWLKTETAGAASPVAPVGVSEAAHVSAQRRPGDPPALTAISRGHHSGRGRDHLARSLHTR